MLGAGASACIAVATLLFARALLSRVGDARWSVASGLALAMGIASVAWVTPLAGSAVVGPALLGAVALAGVVALRRPPPRSGWAPIATWGLVVAGAGTLLVVWAALGTCLWDETTAHFGLVGVVGRGIVPPPHPLFPFHPIRYHHGFDLLAGAVRAFTGARADHAIDAVAIACYASLLALSAAVGRELAGTRGAAWGVVLVPLGSGLLMLLLEAEAYGVTALLPPAWRNSPPPPVISNFFQHPQGLGMPLALTAALLFCREDASRASRAAAAFVLGVLSLAQIVFFAVVGLALGVAAVARAARTGEARWRELGFDAGCLVAALALARSLGGFFVPVGQHPADTLVWGRSYFGEPLALSALHHLAVFGLPLLAIPAAIVAWRGPAPTLRLALVCAALAGFVAPNLVVYRQSWDIVKLYGAGAFFANVLLADVSARALPPRWPWTAGVLLLALPASLFWLVRMTFMTDAGAVPPSLFRPPPAIGEAVAEKLDLRKEDRVLSTRIDLAMGAGLLTPGFSPDDHGGGLLMDRTEAARLHRHFERARRDLRPEDLAALGVRYVALSPEDLAALSEEGRANATTLIPRGSAEAGAQRRLLFEVPTPARAE